MEKPLPQGRGFVLVLLLVGLPQEAQGPEARPGVCWQRLGAGALPSITIERF